MLAPANVKYGSHRSLKTLEFQNSFRGYSKTLEYGPFSHQTHEKDYFQQQYFSATFDVYGYVLPYVNKCSLLLCCLFKKSFLLRNGILTFLWYICMHRNPWKSCVWTSWKPLKVIVKCLYEPWIHFCPGYDSLTWWCCQQISLEKALNPIKLCPLIYLKSEICISSHLYRRCCHHI